MTAPIRALRPDASRAVAGRAAWLGSLLVLAGCHPDPVAAPGLPAVSSTLALTADDLTLWVVNPDADSVSVLDTRARALLAEIPLAASRPAVDPVTRRYEPAVKPRALAISPDERSVYVAAQVAGYLLVIDAATRTVRDRIETGAEPTGVVVAPDGSAVYVVNHQSATVARVDAARGQVTATLAVPAHPWGASLSADGRLLYVSHLLLGAGVTVVDTATFAARSTVELHEQPRDAGGEKRVPNGVPRGVYGATPRPGHDGELWLPHLLLAVKTPQPDLDFQSTVFPTISRVQVEAAAGTAVEGPRLLLRPDDVPGATGAFSDVVSGPRALAFTPDGALALLVSSGSEDVLCFDAVTGTSRALLRPLPATFPEGVVVDRAGRHAYVDGRSSHDVTVLAIDAAHSITPLAVDGPPIDRLVTDPMPAPLRLGQRLFYSANSAAFPITRNFWVSCSSCHIEGGSDAVTWLFTQGPRDTPSNAGGPINTGFLLRQGLRTRVEEYDTTINVEQGGRFDHTDPSQAPLLEALAAFVNYAIPLPQNPYLRRGAMLDEQLRHGADLFQKNCASCHPGAFYTDSGAGNPMLDRDGEILRHDIGTCVQGGDFPDQPAADEITGRMHTACDFDTPTLRGVFATAPYLHDGSAATLLDVVNRLSYSASLPADDKAALVAWLRTL